MPIKVTAPDGSTVSFPDGTSTATIQKAMAKEFGGPKTATKTAPPPKQAPKQRGVLSDAIDGATGFANAVVSGLSKGVYMGLDDEVAGAFGTLIPGGGRSVFEQDGSIGERFSKSYDKQVNQYRGTQRKAEADFPITSTVAQATGAVAPFLITKNPSTLKTAPVRPAGILAKTKEVAKAVVAPSVPAAGKVRNVANAAVVGGTQGTVTGFNEGEGTLANRLASAEAGGVTGVLFGGGLGVLGEAAPLAMKYWNALTGKGSREEAMAQLTAKLKKDGYDLSDLEGQSKLAEFIDERAQRGKDVGLADAGINTRRRTGVALRSENDSRNAGRDIVEGRLASAGDRLKDDVYATVAPKSDVYGESEELIKQRRDAAGPSYEEAYTAPFQINDNIQSILDTPGGKAGLTYARKLAAQDRKDPTKLGLIEVPAPAGGLMETRIQTPTLETMDYVQRAMRAEIEQNTVTDGFGRKTVNVYGQKLQKSLNELLAEMDVIAPAFGKSRGEYRGASELIGALDDGRQFNSLDPEQVKSTVGKLSDPAKEMYRIGAARDLTDRIGNTPDGADPSLRILRTPNERGRLAETGANVDELTTRVGMERDLGLLNQELRGSPTSERDGDRVAAAGEVPTGIVGLVRSAMEWLTEAPLLERNQAINAQFIPMALEMDPANRSKLISELVKQGKTGEEIAQKITNAVTVSSLATSRFVGGATAIREPLPIEDGLLYDDEGNPIGSTADF